eukprot:scaffold145241_cov105-Phaeocystis_antarctica.AAC.1
MRMRMGGGGEGRGRPRSCRMGLLSIGLLSRGPGVGQWGGGGDGEPPWCLVAHRVPRAGQLS